MEVNEIGDYRHTRPKIVRITTHEEYVTFLHEDDHICIIKFYADWCKSCQKFGIKYRHLAHEMGGNVRFAEVEYTASAQLCKTLKVNKLPTCHIYRRGKGKIVDMTCKPSLFHLVVDELNRVLDEAKNDTTSNVETNANVIMNDDEKMKNTTFDMTMVAGSSLGEVIVASLNEKKEDGANKKLLPSWFWK
jgi:thioredoxin-like negative regulator of GroEL